MKNEAIAGVLIVSISYLLSVWVVDQRDIVSQPVVNGTVYFVEYIIYHYRETGDFYYDRYIAVPYDHSKSPGIIAFKDDSYTIWIKNSAIISTRYSIGDFSRGGFEGKRIFIRIVLENGYFREPTEEEQDGEQLKLSNGMNFVDETLFLRELFKSVDFSSENMRPFVHIVNDVMTLDLTGY